MMDNLEEFKDAEAYDFEDSSDTGVPFYATLAQETGGPVLEIACGTGRVTIPIARLGLAVTGLDIMPGMIDLARTKSVGLPAHWVVGDARDFALDERFRLIFLTGNAFQGFLTRADQEALLKCAHAHLEDDGLFAFETRNPRWTTLTTGTDAWATLRTRNGIWTTLETRAEEEEWPSMIDMHGHEVRVTRTQEYDHAAQILHWTSYRRWNDGEREQTKISRIALRFTFPQELLALLDYNGFTVVRQYGDWNYEPLTATSPSIIVVCRKHA